MKSSVVQSLMALNGSEISRLHHTIKDCIAEARWLKEHHEFDKETISWWYNEAEKDRKLLKKAVANQMALKAEIKKRKKVKVSKKHGIDKRYS